MMLIIFATIFIISPPSVGEHGFSGVDLFTWVSHVFCCQDINNKEKSLQFGEWFWESV